MKKMNKYYHFPENTKYNDLLSELVQISVDSLEQMFIPDKNEFAMTKVKIGNNIKLEGKNVRYTLINLIGLQKAQNFNRQFSYNLNNILNTQLERIDKYNGVGELGLLLWATALISPKDTFQLLTKINFHEALNNFKDSKSGFTMELSWFLTGLLFASSFNEKFKSSIDNLPNKVYKKIRKNYGGKGIFQHEDTNNLKGKLRANIGTFADQVYSIYALSLFSKQYQNEEALLIAKQCADKICSHQSKSGEWKWQYDSETGNVISHYPIHSIYQFALAPMALFAIQMATYKDYTKYIFKGLDWIANNNHLNNLIIDKSNNAIWNKITPITNSKLFSILNFLKVKSLYKNKKLKIQFESNSYEFGWILYTFAGRISNNLVRKAESSKNKNDLQVFDLNHQIIK